MNRRLAIVVRIVVIAAIAAGLWWFIRSMDYGELEKDLRSANPWLLVVGAALNFACLFGKGVCWRLMLGPRHKVAVTRLFRYTIATFAASAIAPARAGEVLRVWVLKRRDGVPVADSAAVAVAEKLLDGITMLILVAPVPWLIANLPPEVAPAIASGAAIAITAFIALYIAAGRVEGTTSASSLVRRFVAGMHVLRSPRRLLTAVGVLMLVWAADLLQVMVVLRAVGLDLSPAAGMLILFTLNVAIIVPSTPAQVGALQFGAMYAINALNVNHEKGLAFALLYHLGQIIPLIAAGLAFEWRLVLGREGDPTAASLPVPAPGPIGRPVIASGAPDRPANPSTPA
jgi:glycosyltransferase 2 family protein